MKLFVYTIHLILTLGAIALAYEERGVHIDVPIKGILLSGQKEGNKLSNVVVFLTSSGVVYAADFAVISEDQKSITFFGSPLIANGSSREYSEGKEEWFRVSSGGEVVKSEGIWNLRQIEIIRR